MQNPAGARFLLMLWTAYRLEANQRTEAENCLLVAVHVNQAFSGNFSTSSSFLLPMFFIKERISTGLASNSDYLHYSGCTQ